MKYKISQYAKINNVTNRTIWNWIQRGELKIERTATNRIRIIEDTITRKEKSVAVYARVSSSENKQNLETQKCRLLDYCAAKGYKVDKIVSEIGSGLNDNRQKLERLITDRSIDIIVVEHKDRLARFGLNYIEKLLLMDDRAIEVINTNDNNRDDLMQDFVSIITSFTARLYGQRRTKRKTKQIIKQLEQEEK